MGTHMVLVETSAMVRVESLKGLWTFHRMPASFQYSTVIQEFKFNFRLKKVTSKKLIIIQFVKPLECVTSTHL